VAVIDSPSARGRVAPGRGCPAVGSANATDARALDARPRKKLVPTSKTEARSEAHALYQAERIAARKAGAAVIRITADDETGEVSEAKVLTRFGDVPDDLDQQIEGSAA
jgi:hypothetical protein